MQTSHFQVTVAFSITSRELRDCSVFLAALLEYDRLAETTAFPTEDFGVAFDDECFLVMAFASVFMVSARAC